MSAPLGNYRVTMELPPETIELLRAEAYATLCKESLSESIAAIVREKEELMSTRPPFGVLASKKVRDTFQSKVGEVEDGEAGLRSRLQQVVHIQGWLLGDIHVALDQYLSVASPEYKFWFELGKAIESWEGRVRDLPEKAVAFARDARAAILAFSQQAPSDDRRVREARLGSIAALRATVEMAALSLASISEAATEVSKLSVGKIETPIELPIPTFKSVSWVDGLVIVDAPAAVADLQKAEAEARAFATDGIRALLAYSSQAHESCALAADGYLHAYWDQLREHAIKHYVTVRDVDSVIAELTQQFIAADLRRRQSELISNPFQIER